MGMTCWSGPNGFALCPLTKFTEDLGPPESEQYTHARTHARTHAPGNSSFRRTEETLGPGGLNCVVRLRETGHCPCYRYLHGTRSLGNALAADNNNDDDSDAGLGKTGEGVGGEGIADDEHVISRGVFGVWTTTTTCCLLRRLGRRCGARRRRS